MQIEIKISGDPSADSKLVSLLLALGAIVDGSIDLNGVPASDQPKAVESAPKPAPKKEPIAKQVEKALAEAPAEALEEKAEEVKEAPKKESKYSLEQVRAEAVAISKAGKREEVKALIAKHGGEKVTDLDASVYEAFMADLATLKSAK